MSFVKKASSPHVSSKKSTNEPVPVAVNDQQEQPVQSKGSFTSLITNTESSAENNQTIKSQVLLTITPKQNSLKTQIADLQSIVNGLYKQRNLGLLGKDDKMSLEK